MPSLRHVLLALTLAASVCPVVPTLAGDSDSAYRDQLRQHERENARQQEQQRADFDRYRNDQRQRDEHQTWERREQERRDIQRQEHPGAYSQPYQGNFGTWPPR